MLLCYITDRTQFRGDETERSEQLMEKIAEAARAGVDFIQLREKDLPTRELESLATRAIQRIRAEKCRTKLLINSRTDVAIAAGANGVHLRSKDISPAEVREIYKKYGADTPVREKPIVTVSCHTIEEVIAAEKKVADFALFSPVFEKENDNPAGLTALREACRHKIPIFALGGVTFSNAQSCLRAGAAGVAGIRLFQQNNVADALARLEY